MFAAFQRCSTTKRREIGHPAETGDVRGVPALLDDETP